MRRLYFVLRHAAAKCERIGQWTRTDATNGLDVVGTVPLHHRL